MVDYSSHLYGSIIILGIATFEEFCRYKPTRVKKIRTVRGEVYVLKSWKRNRARYWLHKCVSCKRTGIVRADVLKQWADNGHVCRCKGRGVVHKTCKYCGNSKLVTKAMWYINKYGYADSYCKTCRKARNHEYYIEHAPWNHTLVRNEGGRSL